MARPDEAAAAGAVELQPFEKGRASLLAVPLSVAPGVQAVLELFDKERGFTDTDRRLVSSAAGLGVELLRQALAERQTHRVLFDAVEAALGASDSVAQTLRGTPEQRLCEPPPGAVLQTLRDGLETNLGAAVDAEETLRLVEAVRVLALRHGPSAVRHCRKLTENLRELLDEATGTA